MHTIFNQKRRFICLEVLFFLASIFALEIICNKPVWAQESIPNELDPLPSTEPNEIIPQAPNPMTDPHLLTQELIKKESELIDQSDVNLAALGNAVLVQDIYGAGSSDPSYLTVFNGKLYFNAYHELTGSELWASDGITPAQQISEIGTGEGSSVPAYMTVFKEKLFFCAVGDDGFGYELWAYDGIVPPRRVLDIAPGAGWSYCQHLKVFNDKLYFSADNGDGKGQELWMYTGSGAARRVADIWASSGSSDPKFLTVFKNKLYFSANGNDGKGTELWVYDGVNKPKRAADIALGTKSSEPMYLRVFNNKLYFAADGYDGAGDELWVYDGINNPKRVADIFAGSRGSAPRHLVVHNNLLFFKATSNGQHSLWAYAGYGKPYKALDGGIWNINFLASFNKKLYFGGGDVPDSELWSYSILPQATTITNSSGKYDGWILESGGNTSQGGKMNADSVTLRMGDDSSDRQFRSILHFNTVWLPDNAVITNATLMIKQASLVGEDPYSWPSSLLVDLRKGVFGDSTLIQQWDFYAAPTIKAVGSMVYDGNSWYRLNLPSSSFSSINKVGSTQLRLRFKVDDNDNQNADYLQFFSGNYLDKDSVPKLYITYAVP